MDEIVGHTEEVYQDADLRKEFQKFAALRTVHKAIIKHVVEEVSAQYPASLSYAAITTVIYRRQFEASKIKGLQEGIYFLSRSLTSTLAQRYHISLFQARKLVGSVADKYEREVQGGTARGVG